MIYKPIFFVLMQYCADVEATDQHGMSPLEEAIEKGHEKMVELLL
jgi:hypothetical protein